MTNFKTTLKFIFIAFVALACIYTVDLPELSDTDLSKIIEISSTSKATLISISITIFILLGIQLKVIISSYNIKISTSECVNISISNTLLNHLPAKVGLIFRGIYLKKIHRISYENYGILFLASNIVSMTTASVIGLLSFFFLLIGQAELIRNTVLSTSALILGVIILGQIALSIMPEPEPSIYANRILRSSKLLILKILKWKPGPTILKKLVSSCSLIFAMNCVRLYLSFYALNLSAPVLAIIFIQSCVSVSIIFSVTPGNIGLKEGVILTLATAFDINPEAAVLAAIIDRLSALIPTFVLGPVSLLLLRNRTPE